MKSVNKRQSFELADLFRINSKKFTNKHKLCSDQLKAITAISECRTSKMGGHINRCNSCQHKEIAYNSCRNRHCPKCQYLKQLIWTDKLESKLPVCNYFHVVFTIPSSLHKLFYINQRQCYALLFKATSQTLLKVAENPQHLGAKTGAVSVLHTWGQSLTYHPHIHMIVPGGGLSDDQMEWVEAGKKFFLPVKVLSEVYRGVIWGLLKKRILSGEIKLPDDEKSLESLKSKVYAKSWNVYIKKPLTSPKSVVRYLGNYTHRVAISNNRIIKIDQQSITFSWKDYRKGKRKQNMTLGLDEFMGRFLRHILPSGFYKIRYTGLLAAANGNKRERCQRLIKKSQPIALLQGLKMKQVLELITGRPVDQCPKCTKGKMLPHAILDPD